MGLKLKVLIISPSSVDCVSSLVLFHHIFFHALGKSHWICPAWLRETSQIGNKVALSCLHFCKRIRIHIPMLSQIVIEGGLTRQFAPIDLFTPKWMFSQMLPRNALYGIFFKQAAK